MSHLVHEVIEGLSARLHARSAVLLHSLESRTTGLALTWLLLVSAASLLRIVLSPLGDVDSAMLAPYALLALAPVATFLLALRWFADADRGPQPSIRLARVGRWRDVSAEEARRHPLYGTSGIMLSLTIGMLMNVAFRTGEYLLTMPAINAGAPEWLTTLHLAMTLDTVVIGSLYVVAFAMALRRVALFPRFLALVWLLDLTAQLLVAQAATAVGLPPSVAGALHGLLALNVQKVLISVALWAPYLILSKRVNVTFRHRVAA
jgi:hypothetical protein